MHAKLTGRQGQAAGMVFHIMEEAVIGSNPEAVVHLKAGIVSDRHARIFYDAHKECYFIEDFKSFNGTRLDGEDIRGKKKRLQKYHIISFANLYEFTFQIVADTDMPSHSPAAPAAAAQSDEAKMARTIVVDYNDIVQALPQKTDAYFLEYRTQKGGEQTVMLKDGENTVGRLSASDIMIDNPSISRHHAVVTVRGETVLVRDAGSRNGTFINDQKLEQETEIPGNGELRFGLVRVVLVKKPLEARKK